MRNEFAPVFWRRRQESTRDLARACEVEEMSCRPISSRYRISDSATSSLLKSE